MDDLGVEDDAADLAAREQILRRFPRETLETALRVRHRSGHPERGQAVEDLAEQRVGGAAVFPRSLPSGWTRLPRAMSFVASASVSNGSWSAGVAEVRVGEQDVVRRAASIAALHGPALAGVALAQQAQCRRSCRRRPGRASTISAVLSSCRRQRPAPRPDPCRLRPAALTLWAAAVR